MAYKVPFVNYPEHYRRLKKELDGAFKEIMSHGDYILRQHVDQFESDIASFLKVKYAVGLNSGTDALNLALLAAGIGHGDEVITVAHTFLATVGAIVNCGAKPVLIDVGEDHNMNVDQIDAVITPKTKAIIPVHLNGRSCDMEKVMAIARQHNLLVIEDAAQALGAKFAGMNTGSFGIMSCFSFYPAKVLGTAGDGGMLVSNDREMAATVRALRDNGRVTGQDEVLGYGFNSRLDNLHAAMLNIKLKYLPGWIERRRELAAIYDKGLSGIKQLKLLPAPVNDGKYYDVFQNYVIRSQERDKLRAHLKDTGIETLISWPIPMNHQKALNLGHFNLPVTETLSQEVISLPLYPELNNEQAEYVIESIRKFYGT